MENRPDPDSLLSIVKKDRSLNSRGRLKVFFGASAGVGKTYAMLLAAHRKLEEGVDVVIGTIESHGRTQTAELIDGLQVIPLREIIHRGVTLYEFNLEGALERKPSLILMDEFAHTNAPGSRHPKRWQDVDELLSHGIDVYTTLNVQHLESINDMVAKLTGIVVRETVPDSIFDSADEISLIDIPSDELLKRLYDGKVYIAEGADKRAAQNFFKKTNLVALREMALRRMADRVDAENDILTAAQGQKEAQLGQKILVCVGHDALSTRVIRHAKRMASRAKAPWFAMYIETGRHESLSEKDKLIAEQNLRLAEKMGAKIVRITADSAVDEIIDYAHNNGFTRIVIGHKTRPKYMSFLDKPLCHKLVERGTGLEITAVTESISNERRPFLRNFKAKWGKSSDYVKTLFLMILTTIVAYGLSDWLGGTEISMIYMAMVVFVAAYWGTSPSVFASLISVLLFFVIFKKRFNIYNFQYLITFGVMFLTSMTVGSLAARLSLQARQARRREAETSILYALTKELSSVRSLEGMASVSLGHLETAFDKEAIIFLRIHGELQVFPVDMSFDEKEESVVNWILENGTIAGRSTDTMPSAKAIYVPLMSENETFGAIGIFPDSDHENYEFTIAEISRLETFASLIATAIQRVWRANDAERVKLASENEKLRNILLSSISHDLRTPLASIVGAVSNALMLRSNLSPEMSHLLEIIQTQSARLTKLVTHLLDVSSLESDMVQLNRQPHLLSHLIYSAVSLVSGSLEGRKLHEDIDEELPHQMVDGLLVEQIIANILDNAICYTDENEGEIYISAHIVEDELVVSVKDNGKGIPEGYEEKIFEKTYSGSKRSSDNSSLGLTICRNIIEAHGGELYAERLEKGTAFYLKLPVDIDD